jgi:hypothetical protein
VFSLLIAASGHLGEPEELSRSDLLGIASVLVGVTLVALGAPHSRTEPTLAQASSALEQASFAVPACLALVGAAGCLSAPFFGARWKGLNAFSACGAATCGALSQLALKLLSLSVREASIATGGAWPPPAAFFGMCGLAITAPSQLALLNIALSARASLVIPIYQASLLSLTTLTGGAAFHEFDAMSLGSACVYGTGVLAAGAGLLALSSGGGSDDELVDDPEDDAATAAASATPADAAPAGFGVGAQHVVEAASLDALLGSPLGGSPEGDEVARALATARLRAPLLDNAELETDSLDARLPRVVDGRTMRATSPHQFGARRRSSVSRMPAPILMGIGVAVLESRGLSERGPRLRSQSSSAEVGRTPARAVLPGSVSRRRTQTLA